MAAPTPVSALVHSSTLVTAGVYLLLRFNLLLCNNMFVILMLGCITMVMAGVSGLTESDMKKIIALSTLSQLGVMFFSVGLGEVFLRYFHLISHAYFKAIIFICAGAIIHRIGDYQDQQAPGPREQAVLHSRRQDDPHFRKGQDSCLWYGQVPQDSPDQRLN